MLRTAMGVITTWRRPLMMPMPGRVRAAIIVPLAVCGLNAPAVPALAAGSNMPWEPLQQILQSIEGSVPKVIAVIVIITTGLSIAFAASSFFVSFFSFGGGPLI
jgi:type IV secretory pathway VirB2 component (pilin)